MVDTGMNRLGIGIDEIGSRALDGLHVDTLMSHLACADMPGHPLNGRQLDRFRTLAAAVPAKRRSLANSAGIFLGADYAFDLTRPGLALYGGVPVPTDAVQSACIRQVVTPEAQVIQVRTVPAGDGIGYGATFVAPAAMHVAILNIGYADGFRVALGARGRAMLDGHALPIVGRISMDLIAVDVGKGQPTVREGDWLGLEFPLPVFAAASGVSQYELLTGLGDRFERLWV
jgi:alanine racemase